MLYITYNEPPSGIYFSQVTDVCRFLNSNFKVDVKLVAFISLRNFLVNRNKIKNVFENSVILPMFPGVNNWRWNIFLLLIISIFNNSKKIIARGPFACILSIWLKKAGLAKYVCFDARGAYSAEINEYDVYLSQKIKKEINSLEKRAVLNSDFRISVSEKLVNYWNENFGYNISEHSVIPCTIMSDTTNDFFKEEELAAIRKSLGFNENDIVLVYSGSSAGWQSFNLLNEFFRNIMSDSINVKVLFLSKSNLSFINEFNNRVVVKWLDEMDVHKIICCGDYGILLRENSITNSVSAPVKFGEYLSSGLNVIISDHIGDYSDFVRERNCGIVLSDIKKFVDIKKINYSEKINNHKLAIDFFSKHKYLAEYKRIIV